MGSQIAALLAGLGMRVRLYDIVPPGAQDRNQLARQALQRLLGQKPAPAYTPQVLASIEPANLEDDLPRLAEADWVIEAVAEDLAVKRQVWERVAGYVRRDAILSTNTSGLSIGAIGEALPADLRPRFLGTHFFNPPRYLRLLEVVPGPETDSALVAEVAEFARYRFGKGVVVCRDTPYFIANRIGVYGFLATFRAMESLGLDVAAVDAVTGPALGRPNSATFRTLDVVGLDVFAAVVRNLAQALPDEAASFQVPPVVEELVRKGHLGEKAGAGFYRREGDRILVLDLRTGEYGPRRDVSFPSLEAARRVRDVRERIRVLVSSDDLAGRLAWEAIKAVWLYAAERLEEIAGGRIDAVDRAMCWGFGWEIGPFAAWDAAGVPETAERIARDGQRLPATVEELLASGRRSWYEEDEGGRVAFWSPRQGLTPVESDPRALTFAARKRAGGLIRSWPGASLVDLGEGVLGVELHAPKGAIGPDALSALSAAAEEAPKSWQAVVIGTDENNFGVGANLAILLGVIQEGAWDEVDSIVRRFQQVLLALKYLPVPVVAAVRGLALGGSLELALAAARVVAAPEAYMGLVEVSAGLVPAGGGCKEMILRALAAARAGQGSSPMLPAADPLPFVARVFEAIATARTSSSALEARQLGFLTPCDRIVPNPDYLLWAAREEAIHLAAAGWSPPLPPRVAVLGSDGRAALALAAYHQLQSGRATEYDVRVATELAGVLAGGDVPAGTEVGEAYLLDLEREAFLRLCREAKTQARIVHLLQHGKPLRN